MVPSRCLQSWRYGNLVWRPLPSYILIYMPSTRAVVFIMPSMLCADGEIQYGSLSQPGLQGHMSRFYRAPVWRPIFICHLRLFVSRVRRWYRAETVLVIFLPRDAMHKCGLCCRPMSVRPTRSCIVSMAAEDIVKLLSRRGSPMILVFLIPGADTQFQGEPRQRGRKIHGVGKLCDFRLKSPFISETVRDRPMITMER